MNPEETITTTATINAPIEKVWEYYTNPEHITKWAFADSSWEAPFAENDLKVGGKFLTRMQAKDKSAGFDFNGIYTAVEKPNIIEYTMEGGRKVSVKFTPIGDKTKVVVDFEMEHENSKELQQQGWQSILNNFKTHVEE